MPSGMQSGGQLAIAKKVVIAVAKKPQTDNGSKCKSHKRKHKFDTPLEQLCWQTKFLSPTAQGEIYAKLGVHSSWYTCQESIQHEHITICHRQNKKLLLRLGLSPIQKTAMVPHSIAIQYVEFRRIELSYAGRKYVEDMDDATDMDMDMDDHLAKMCLRDELHECINQHQPSLLLFGINTNSYGVFIKNIVVLDKDTHVLTFLCGTNRVEPSEPYQIGGFHCSVVVRKQ